MGDTRVLTLSDFKDCCIKTLENLKDKPFLLYQERSRCDATKFSEEEINSIKPELYKAAEKRCLQIQITKESSIDGDGFDWVARIHMKKSVQWQEWKFQLKDGTD